MSIAGKTKKAGKPGATRATRRRKESTSGKPKRAAKAGDKKFFDRRRRREKEAAGAETGAGAFNKTTSQIPHEEHAISMRAETQLIGTPSALTKAQQTKGQREETARNREFSNAHFFFKANGDLDELLRRAKKGDIDAARKLRGCLTHNIELFLAFCAAKPKTAKQSVVLGESWPLLHTDLKANKQRILKLPSDHILRALGVVSNVRTYDSTALLTSIAHWLYRTMEFYRRGSQELGPTYEAFRRLKPFSPRNCRDWWKAANLLFEEHWGKEFQDDRDFRNWNTGSYDHENGRPVRWSKRDAIRKALQQAFESLANSLG